MIRRLVLALLAVGLLVGCGESKEAERNRRTDEIVEALTDG
jgi:uncharacterized lipoprotein